MRLSNICTYKEGFDKYAKNIKSWFLKTGHSKQIIDSQMKKKKKKMGKVKFGQMLKIGSKHAGVDVLFVITYHPKCKKIAQKARAPIVSG